MPNPVGCHLNKKNELKNKTQYSKTARWVAKKIMEPKSRGYITEIIEEIPKVTSVAPEKNDKLEATDPNPREQEILSKQISRFSKEMVSNLEPIDP